MRKMIWSLFALLFLIPIGIIAFEYRKIVRPLDQNSTRQSATSKEETIRRGHYLAQLGDCMACHTVSAEHPYAGNRALNTPFGTLYTSNLTPDKETGIGTWSEDDFWQALHLGISKNKQFLYPAFPYPNYTRVTRADADALYAYLQTLSPVHQSIREPELSFPFNYRILLGLWRFMYFQEGTFIPDVRQSKEWNRGAYFVQGLGHCNACHTTRNAFGATESSRELAGGFMTSLHWYAPSLTGNRDTGLGSWDESDIVDILKTGISRKGTVFGPMAEVVYQSLQYVSESDLHAMAVYLKTLPAESLPAKELRSPQVSESDQKTLMLAGKKLYQKYCMDCHQADGQGIPPHYPPLAGNHALTMFSAVNPIRMVLNGGFSPATSGNPQPYSMPPFRHLSNEEVAAVVSYVLASWGNNQEPVSPVEVDRYRSIPE